MKKNTNNNLEKIGGFNVIIIAVISFLYILLITKIGEIISIQYYPESSDADERIGLYVMIIYFISIIGIILGFILLNSNKNGDYENPNWIVKWSLSIGGIVILIYTMINYWEFLNDYCKTILIFLSMVSIIYYLYKYY
jgi:hypothetical protein